MQCLADLDGRFRVTARHHCSAFSRYVTGPASIPAAGLETKASSIMIGAGYPEPGAALPPRNAAGQ
ncbi:hypothetical protein Aca07nite_59780 [Actinoplanes capillaceus]|uniref:Uncharacterized protein n=1 Tax=Actinoplanes campanulatus TaxID=113559 RepID=A0ABQ3WQY9_9ACTN|nr:hypothetical protein Aca07nite_59780 [Actinoplanes capillaceus]